MASTGTAEQTGLMELIPRTRSHGSLFGLKVRTALAIGWRVGVGDFQVSTVIDALSMIGSEEARVHCLLLVFFIRLASLELEIAIHGNNELVL